MPNDSILKSHSKDSANESSSAAKDFYLGHREQIHDNHRGKRPKLRKVLNSRFHKKSQHDNDVYLTDQLSVPDKTGSKGRKHKTERAESEAARTLAIVPNKHNTVKLNQKLIDKLNDLVTKKTLDNNDETEQEKMWSKEMLLANSAQALAYKAKDPMQKNYSEVHLELGNVNDRIQTHYQELKMSRERKKKIDDWVCSFMHPDQAKTNKKIEKRTQRLISQKMNRSSMQNENSTMSHLNAMNSDNDQKISDNSS